MIVVADLLVPPAPPAILKSSYEELLYIYWEVKKSQLESKGVLVLKYAQS